MKIPYLRWWVAFALFLAAVLNYIDRSLLGMLAPTIQQDLGISDQDYANVVSWFLVAYTVAYLLSGRIVDKLGVRLSLALFVGWWSISNALTGMAHSLRQLSVFRFMLGLGEAGGFTASPKAVAEWFPPAERGIAVGLYSVGGAVGATLAPLIVATISAHYGWRWVFAVSPVLAGLWLVFWLWLYRRPGEHPRITDKEKAHLAGHLAATAAAEAAVAAAPPQPESALWKMVFSQPFVWRLMLARMLTDPVWYFYQFWMPKYLHSTRQVDQSGLAIMWMVFLAADVGFLLSGFLAGRLIKRGTPPPAARLWIMLMSACLVPASLLVPSMQSVPAVIAVGMLVAYAHTAWLGNLTSLVVDITPRAILGTAFGVIACGSTLGGIFMNKSVAWFVDHRSYDDCFYIMACLHPLAILFVWKLRKRTNPDNAAATEPAGSEA
ncbi:MAG: MFS transporter [Terrimicrobiaceae bacterium]